MWQIKSERWVINQIFVSEFWRRENGLEGFDVWSERFGEPECWICQCQRVMWCKWVLSNVKAQRLHVGRNCFVLTINILCLWYIVHYAVYTIYPVLDGKKKKRFWLLAVELWPDVTGSRWLCVQCYLLINPLQAVWLALPWWERSYSVLRVYVLF